MPISFNPFVQNNPVTNSGANAQHADKLRRNAGIIKSNVNTAVGALAQELIQATRDGRAARGRLRTRLNEGLKENTSQALALLVGSDELLPKLIQNQERFTLIDEITGLRKKCRSYLDTWEGRFNTGSNSSANTVYKVIAELTDHLLDQEQDIRHSKSLQHQSDFNSSSLWYWRSPAERASQSISTFESENFRIEIAKEKIKTLQDFQSLDPTNARSRSLIAIDFTFRGLTQLLALVTCSIEVAVRIKPIQNADVIQKKIFDDMDYHVLRFCKKVKELQNKMGSNEFRLSDFASPVQKNQLKERVTFACELLPINRFIEELCVSILAFILEKDPDFPPRLVSHLSNLVYFTGSFNSLVGHLCAGQGWDELIHHNPNGDLLLAEALQSEAENSSAFSEGGRNWYSRVYDYIASYFAGPIPVVDSVQATDSLVDAAIDSTDHDQSPVPNSAMEISPSTMTLRLAKFVRRGEKLLAASPLSLVRNYRERPGFYAPDIMFKLYGLFVPKALELVRDIQSLSLHLQQSILFDQLDAEAKAQISELKAKLEICKQQLQREVDYSQSEAFRYGTLKQYSMPREEHWKTLIDADQLDQIEYMGKLPTTNEKDFLYEFKLCPKHQGPEQYKPVWLHIHLSKPVHSAKQWQELQIESVKAAHLKSDEMRPRGARWQMAQREDGQFDAVVQRSAVSLDFAKSVAGLAFHKRPSDTIAKGRRTVSDGQSKRASVPAK